MNNVGFVNDANDLVSSLKKESITIPQTNDDNGESSKVGWEKKRDSWGKSIEFLMSCIAMSVGLGRLSIFFLTTVWIFYKQNINLFHTNHNQVCFLGNVWRFPFSALENGGGAFLLPYLVVLFTIGRPLYYMEMVVGQFSGRNAVDLYDMVPFFRGTISESFFSLLAFFEIFFRSRIRSRAALVNIFVEHILCLDHGASRSISVGIIRITATVDKMQKRVAQLH